MFEQTLLYVERGRVTKEKRTPKKKKTSKILASSSIKHICPSTCAVCGDKAIGYHYEVGSCSGCKTFFRRTIQSERKFVCRFNGKCKDVMNKVHRVKCRACRFDRCIEVGMNPLAVTCVPQSNSIVRAFVAERGFTATFKDETEEEEEVEEADKVSLLSSSLAAVEHRMERAIEQLLFLDRAHQKLRRSRFNPKQRDHPIDVEWCLQGSSRMGVEYGEMPLPPVPPPFHSDFVLMEIRIRDCIPFRPRKDFKPTADYKWWLMTDLVYTIEWMKALSFFHELQAKEQRRLIKDITFSIVLLSAAFYSYEERRSGVLVMPDGMVFVQGELPLEAKQDRDQNFEIIERMRSLSMDRREYVLLKGILAADPTHEDLSPTSRKMLEAQRESLSKALMSYLLARRGSYDGPRTYLAMMDFISWLTVVIKRGKNLFFLLSALSLKCLKIPDLMDFIFSP